MTGGSHYHLYVKGMVPGSLVCLNDRCPEPQILQDAPAVRSSPTSVEAAEKITPHTGRLRKRVLAALTERPMTDEEGIAATGIAASTYRPRRVELVQEAMVVDTGERRQTRSGRQAVVWGAIEPLRLE